MLCPEGLALITIAYCRIRKCTTTLDSILQNPSRELDIEFNMKSIGPKNGVMDKPIEMINGLPMGS